MNSLTKICCKCEQDKPLEAFHFCSRSPDRRQYWCIACRAEYDRGRRDLEPLEPESITRLLANWKPPIVNVRLVQVSNRKREASGA